MFSGTPHPSIQLTSIELKQKLGFKNVSSMFWETNGIPADDIFSD